MAPSPPVETKVKVEVVGEGKGDSCMNLQQFLFPAVPACLLWPIQGEW